MSKLQLSAVALLVAALSVWSRPALGQGGDRLPDKDVKMIIDQVDEGRDKFEGNLDDRFKNSTLRGPSGEVKVSNLLQDYQDSTKKLQDRFQEDYAATAEATIVLNQGAKIENYMEGNPSVTKGRKEWDVELGSLKRLARAYGATFPLPAGATLRRVNDKETAAAAEAVAAAADRFKDDVDDATLSKPDKEAGKRDVELLKEQAEGVKDKVNDSRPATGEAKRLAQQAAKVQAFVDAHHLSTPNWERVRTSLGTVRKSFGLE